MYDPVLGRFIQADSIVQDPFDPQSLNRYAYVLNNPLSATDPSGNISFKNALKLGVAIGITVVTSGTATSLLLSGAINGFQAVAIVAAGGALAGAVSGCGLKGALRGAFTAAVFFGVGQGATALKGATGKFGAAAFANNGLGRAALHGVAGGALASLQGGNFGHGFLTAGVGRAVTSRGALTGNDLSDSAIAALVGGTLSEASGDSFTNGALTGAMQFAFNQLFDPNADEFDPEKCRNAGCTNPRLVNANQAVAEGFDKTAIVIDELAVDQVKYAWLGPLAGPVARFVRATHGFFRFGKVTRGLGSLGRAGTGKGVREVVGDAGDARKLFDQLRGSNPVTEVKRGVFTAPGTNGGTVTFRATSKSGPPTVDVNGIEEGIRKIKFVDQ